MSLLQLWIALLACQAPPLEIEGPPGPISGALPLGIQADGPIQLEGPSGAQRLDPGAAIVDTTEWPDGEHTLTLTATRWGRSTTRALRVQVDQSPPNCVFDDRARISGPGQTLALLIRCDEPFTGTLEVLHRPRPLYPLGEGIFRALIGVPLRTPPGRLPATLHVQDALGNAATHALPIQIREIEWPFTGKLPLSRRKMVTQPEDVQEMRRARDAVYAHHSPEASWTAPFALPASGTHTSAFGSYREYPNGRRSYHDAEDIARRRHTPIYAPAPGRVALATSQAIHGNAVLLDHGQGVVSLYSHLHRLDVELDQWVEAGEQLGTMGSTGRTTGPHLHWGIIVDGVPVDPMAWTESAFDAQGARWTALEP